jgi:hypothetical protein
MIYDNFASDLVSGVISPSRDTFFLMLVHSYIFNAAHSRRSDVQRFETSASGYVKGGQPTATSHSKAGARTTILFSDVKWDISGQMTATGAVVYKANGGLPSGDELVCFLDFGKDVTCTDSTFTAHFASGLGIETR